MDFYFRRSYRGPLQAVIFDWAGTTLDYSSYAPIAALLQLFGQHGLHITTAQARIPMGLHKRDHIRTILQLEPIRQQWHEQHQHAWTEADVESLYQQLTAIQAELIGDYAELIPGTLATLADCRARHLKIGSTTGYNQAMMHALLPLASAQGYTPDALVCPDQVAAGRPAPWMIFQNAMQLGVYPMAAIVKVGDTLPDISEGLNAGVWTIGLTRTGNELGLLLDEQAALAPDALATRLAQIRQQFLQAGAHAVVESIADVPAVLDNLAAAVQRGEQP